MSCVREMCGRVVCAFCGVCVLRVLCVCCGYLVDHEVAITLHDRLVIAIVGQKVLVLWEGKEGGCLYVAVCSVCASSRAYVWLVRARLCVCSPGQCRWVDVRRLRKKAWGGLGEELLGEHLGRTRAGGSFNVMTGREPLVCVYVSTHS